MNLTLIRDTYRPDGIFGRLFDQLGRQIAVTLEHAYQQSDGSFQPKIPVGSYRCLFGQHQLGSGPIQTFQVMNVPGHSGILIHPGNFDSDSSGCILIGEAIAETDSAPEMITKSKLTFAKFIEIESGAAEFLLTVTNGSL